MNKDEREIEKGLSLIVKSSFVVFIAILFSKVFSYFYRIIIARYYGPEVYGLFSLGLMIFLFLRGFTSLGLFEGLIKFIPSYRGQGKKNEIRYLFRFSFYILLIFSLISGIALYFTSEFISLRFFNDINLAFYLKIFAFLIPVQILTTLFLTIIRAHEKIKPYAFGLHIVEKISKLLFILIFILLGVVSYKAVSFSYFLAILSSLIFAYFYCRFKLRYVFAKSKIPKKDKFPLLNKLFSYSWPLVLYGMISSLMYSIDTFFIGYFTNSYWVGIYNSAIPLAIILFLASEMFMQMFFPMIIREASSKKGVVVKELSKQITKWIFMINLPLTMLMVLFPGVFINIFFGEAYLHASNALRILAIGQFVFSIGIISNGLLRAYGKSKTILVSLILTSIINIVLNWVFIPRYGIEGAAASTTISIILLSLIFFLLNYRVNKIIPFRRKMITIFLISLIPFFALYKISQEIHANLVSLILAGTFFVAIYLLLILLTKSFDKNDLGVINKILNYHK